MHSGLALRENYAWHCDVLTFGQKPNNRKNLGTTVAKLHKGTEPDSIHCL